MEHILKRAGKRLELLRVNMGLSVRELSNALKINRDRLGKIERGEVNFNMIELLKLLNFYNAKLPENKNSYTTDEILLGDDFHVRDQQ